MKRITLRAARVNAGILQKDASQLLGISNKTLSSWENNITVPKADMIDKICNLYKVCYNDLIFFTK